MERLRMVQMDLQRAFCGRLFLVGLLCLVGVCYLNVSWNNYQYESVVSLIAGLAFGGFVQMIFVCGAIPYAVSYLSDCESGYIRFLVIRGDLRRYLRSKVFVTALSGFSAVFAGKLLFALSLCAAFPLTQETDIMLNGGVELLFDVHPWAYIAGDAFLYAMASAAFAVMALLVSSLIRNMFVTLMSPLVLYFMITSLQQIVRVPQAIGMNGLMMGYIDGYLDSWQWTLLHIFLVWLIVILVTGKLFVWRAERRFYHG